MNTVRIGRLLALTLALAALTLSGCNEGPGNKPAPVELVATVTQDVRVFDADFPDCETPGEIQFRNIIKRPGVATDERFLDVVLTSMRTSYRRTDGGTMVPQPWTQTLDLLIPATGEAVPLEVLFLFQMNALSGAPFAALRPINGGVDPETGRREVKIEVIQDFFGETLSGENVSARARWEFTVCAACGGC